MAHGWYELPCRSVTFPSRVTESIQVHRVKTISNKKTWRLVFRRKLKADEILKCTNRWWTMTYIHSNIFRLLPQAISTSATRNMFLIMSTRGKGLSAIICKMLPQILIITKNYKFPCSAVNIHVTLRYVDFYFLSAIRLISGLISAVALAT